MFDFVFHTDTWNPGYLLYEVKYIVAFRASEYLNLWLHYNML